MTLLPDFLEGAVDLHVHSAPDVDECRFDDVELAREAARSGMDAILIKSHQNSTVERAFLVSRMVPDVRVYGGLVLNDTVGGLNAAAVRLAVSLGAKEIWMPTRSAENHRRHHGMTGGIPANETGPIVHQDFFADKTGSTGQLKVGYKDGSTEMLSSAQPLSCVGARESPPLVLTPQKRRRAGREKTLTQEFGRKWQKEMSP